MEFCYVRMLFHSLIFLLHLTYQLECRRQKDGECVCLFFVLCELLRIVLSIRQAFRKHLIWWIPTELFQILKDDAGLNMPANLENSAVVTGLEKVSFHFNPKDNGKESSNYCTIAFISHASKVMLKNPSNKALMVHEQRTFRCTSWI